MDFWTSDISYPEMLTGPQMADGRLGAHLRGVCLRSLSLAGLHSVLIGIAYAGFSDLHRMSCGY